ncbi:coiled-coil domain-containing protein 43 [Cimex lectularius]|uniref:Coiled-coil domain-containing protein 43 n=1 Tax=Cimex lectularius TaxID=79782 RepID=A0A8I6RU80_CIMLE|nr:coiled-coil domain-containing protein 43 [Cimex lectularius]
MATSLESDGEFHSWLTSKLNSLNTDESVFGSYITGILTGDYTPEEMQEALEGIIREITEDNIGVLCREILDKWAETQGSKAEETPVNKATSEDVEEQLVKLLEKNTLCTTVQREYTEDERKLREAILAQYSQTSVQEEAEEEDGDDEGKENGLVKNTNLHSVIQAKKEQREKAKIDSQKKKEKDREDRERQKQQAAEKKEKRKTQKGERRR